MNTCGKCNFYEPGLTIKVKQKDETVEKFPGGYCFGGPPSITEGKSEYPTVREDQRECALWRAPITKRKTR